MNPSPLAQGLLAFVGLSRAAFGVACLLAPPVGMQFLGLLSNNNTSPTEAATVLCRMFGVREIVVGGVLVLAERGRRRKMRKGRRAEGEGEAEGLLTGSGGTNGGGEEEVRRAIWWNVATDGMDVLAIGVAFAVDGLEGRVFGKMVATALVYVGLGLQVAWLYS